MNTKTKIIDELCEDNEILSKMFKISSDDYMKMLKTKIKLLKRKTKDSSNEMGSHVSYENYILPNYSTNILTAKLTIT